MIQRSAVFILVLLVRAYRVALAPVIPTSCRHYPSCSHYAEAALREHGAFRGARVAVRRLLRCHPFSEGGYDPVPGRGK